MRSVWTISHLTLYEARRRRIVVAALVCGAAFLAVFWTAMFFVRREMIAADPPKPFVETQAMMAFFTLAGLYATNFLSVLFAVLLPVDALSGEIDSGVMQTLASKPVRRADIVIGKWFGHGMLVVAYVLFLAFGVLLATRLVAGYIAINVTTAVLLIVLEALLLMTASIAGGTRLSTVTNGVVALGWYGIAFIGGWVEQVGAISGVHAAKMVGIIASLLSPADVLWRLASFHMQPPAVRGLGPLLFAVASLPSTLMVWWAAGFGILLLIWAIRSFNGRAL